MEWIIFAKTILAYIFDVEKKFTVVFFPSLFLTFFIPFKKMPITTTTKEGDIIFYFISF